MKDGGKQLYELEEGDVAQASFECMIPTKVEGATFQDVSVGAIRVSPVYAALLAMQEDLYGALPMFQIVKLFVRLGLKKLGNTKCVYHTFHGSAVMIGASRFCLPRHIGATGEDWYEK